MRVLWLAGNNALYKYSGDQHGGWIGALQRELQKENNVVLGVGFPWTESIKEVRDSVIYYGIKDIRHPIFRYEAKLKTQLLRLQTIVDDFKPDIIHVFGTEIAYGMIAKQTKIPVIVHIQGVLGAIYEAWLPQNLSWLDYILGNPRVYLGYDALRKFVPREREIYRHCRFFMGRTEWDKQLSQLLSPGSTYFHCDEMLRPEIVQTHAWQSHASEEVSLVSVVGEAPYKGIDVILRTAKILKDIARLHFTWNVIGVQSMCLSERLTGIKAADVNVLPQGRADVIHLIKWLQEATMFVHPSYIENSSNAICEAQYIGLPVIATHVGGTTSLITHEKTGIVMPANDVYLLASQVVRLAKDRDLCLHLGANSRKEAMARHAPKTIISTLLNIYQSVLHE